MSDNTYPNYAIPNVADIVNKDLRIKELEAENERLREALTTIRDRKWNTMTQGCDAACEAAHLARAALTGKAEQ